MEIKKRNYLIDNCKGLMIFLVVLGHSLELLRKEFELTRIIYVFIYLFHMPVFIFISGYLSKNIEKGRKEAVQKLLIPFLFFNIIWGLLQMYSYNITGRIHSDITVRTVFSFFVPGWALWYVFSMFLWKIIMPDVVKIKKAFLVILFIGVTARLFTEFDVFMSLSRTLVFFPFFVAGYYVSEERLFERKQYSKYKAIGIIIGGIVLAFLLVKFTNIPDEFLWADRSYSSFEVTASPIFGVLLGGVVYCIGFAFVYAVIALMPIKETFLCKLGRNTRSIYFLHPYCVILVLGGSALVPTNIGKLLFTIVGALVVTFILSNDKIAKGLNRFLFGLNKKIFKKEKESMS